MKKKRSKKSKKRSKNCKRKHSSSDSDSSSSSSSSSSFSSSSSSSNSDTDSDSAYYRKNKSKKKFKVKLASKHIPNLNDKRPAKERHDKLVELNKPLHRAFRHAESNLNDVQKAGAPHKTANSLSSQTPPTFYHSDFKPLLASTTFNAQLHPAPTFQQSFPMPPPAPPPYVNDHAGGNRSGPPYTSGAHTHGHNQSARGQGATATTISTALHADLGNFGHT